MTDIKKKLLITALAGAMVTTSTSFAMLRIHGEGEAVIHDTTSTERVEAKKALLTNTGTVTGRNDDNTTDSTNITDLNLITDLMIDENVMTVAAEKFNGKKNLTTLTFKNASTSSQLTSIGRNAFKGTGITSVELPKSLSVIDVGAFANTTALTSVNFTNSKNLEHIKQGAFENSGLTVLDLTPINASTKSSLTLGTEAFKGNQKLATVTLSTKVTTLPSKTFASTKVTNFHVSKNVASLSPDAFADTPLATITVDSENSLFKVDSNVLYMKYNSSLYLFLYPEGRVETSFTFPDTVTYIWPLAIHSPKYLRKLIIGRGLTSIEQDLFANAPQLTTLDLRNAVSLGRIGMHAFKSSALSSIIIGAKTGPLTSIGDGAFDSTAISKQVSFLDDSNNPIKGNTLKTLVSKYKALKNADKGSWFFDVHLPTPTASADYTNMKLTNLEASTRYKIQNVIYTTDATGKLDLLRTWSKHTINIVRNPGEADESLAQELPIEGIYTLTMDGEESLKKEGVSISVTAPEKRGHVFTRWASVGVDLPNPTEKNNTFVMPASDVTLTKEYTELTVETQAEAILFNGKNDVVITLTSPLSNFVKLTVNGVDLTKNVDYTMTGDDKLTLTLKKLYLDPLTSTTDFVVTFREGGEVTFQVRCCGPAPTAAANYDEMKLTGLEENALYKINNVVKTTDATGKLTIEKEWSSIMLEIIKQATGTGTDSKPQNLNIEKLYTIKVNGIEIGYKNAGTVVKVKADSKKDHRFKEWKAKKLPLTNTKNEELTFEMPTYDVELELVYDFVAKIVDPEVTPALPEATPTPPKPSPVAPKLPTPKLPTTNPKVENTTIKTPFVKGPKTGDHSNLYIVYLTMLLSMGIVLFMKKRRKQ